MEIFLYHNLNMLNAVLVRPREHSFYHWFCTDREFYDDSIIYICVL